MRKASRAKRSKSSRVYHRRVRAYVRARVNARACIAITLRTSRKSITIQLCLAQRKMIRTVGAHLYFRLSFGAIISYTGTCVLSETVHNNLDTWVTREEND